MCKHKGIYKSNFPGHDIDELLERVESGGDVFIASFAETTYDEIDEAFQAGKLIVCKAYNHLWLFGFKRTDDVFTFEGWGTTSTDRNIYRFLSWTTVSPSGVWSPIMSTRVLTWLDITQELTDDEDRFPSSACVKQALDASRMAITGTVSGRDEAFTPDSVDGMTEAQLFDAAVSCLRNGGSVTLVYDRAGDDSIDPVQHYLSDEYGAEIRGYLATWHRPQ